MNRLAKNEGRSEISRLREGSQLRLNGQQEEEGRSDRSRLRGFSEWIVVKMNMRWVEG